MTQVPLWLACRLSSIPHRYVSAVQSPGLGVTLARCIESHLLREYSLASLTGEWCSHNSHLRTLITHFKVPQLVPASKFLSVLLFLPLWLGYR